MLQLATFIEEVAVPALSSFIDGLTGKNSLGASFTETQKSAQEWGKRVRTVFDIVVDLKEVALATAAILTTMFVVSKIQAAVVATIAIIRTLIAAYNALKASAIVAGVAAAFALNPLLGVGAAALAAGVLSAANAIANKSNAALPENISGSSGSNTVPAASLPSGFTAGTTGAKTTIPTVPTVTTTTGTTTKTTTGTIAAAPTLVPSGQAIPSTFDVAAARAGESAGITINVNAPSVIDETGFTRAVQLAIQQTQQRGSSGSGFAQIL